MVAGPMVAANPTPTTPDEIGGIQRRYLYTFHYRVITNNAVVKGVITYY